MASIGKDRNGSKRILFVAPDGKRKTIRLGKTSQRMAEAFKVRVERLLTAKLTGDTVDDDTARWLAERDNALIDKLARVGLAKPRNSTKLGPFLDHYIESRSEIKPNTKRNYKNTRRWLVDHFGEDRDIRSINAGDAEKWRQWMINQGGSEATVSRDVKRARQFFAVALRRKLISENPFVDIKTPAQVNAERQHYVSIEDTAAILEECRNPKQRLMIALGRIAGLRFPSEFVGLRWSEVNWERGRFVVHAPKTERHGTGTRVVPFFGELEQFFQAAQEAAPEGQDRIFPEITPKSNRRTWLLKVVRRAGVEEFEKPWVNLRASAVTDAADVLPGHVCEAWFGHSEAIANRHYRQVKEAHFKVAAKVGVLSVPRGTESGTVVAQNPAQKAAAHSSTLAQETTKALAAKGFMRDSSVTCGAVPTGSIPPRGVEPLSSD